MSLKGKGYTYHFQSASSVLITSLLKVPKYPSDNSIIDLLIPQLNNQELCEKSIKIMIYSIGLGPFLESAELIMLNLQRRNLVC